MTKSEIYSHIVECPECNKIVDTIPAEGIPDQLLRSCPNCGAVFFQDIDQTTY